MVKNLIDFFKSLSLIKALITYKYNGSYGVSINNILYDGLDKNPTPIKHFKYKTKSKHYLIIYPGASHGAEEHESLHTLGLGFARIGYEVYVPRIPPLKALQISDDVVEWMAYFYSWFLKNIHSDNTNISVMGVSFGGAMVLKTSLSNIMMQYPPKTLFSYGTYYEIESVIEFLYSGKITKDGNSIHLTPDNWALIGILYNFLPKVDVGFKTDKLVDALKYHIYVDEVNLEATLNVLSNEERNVWRILTEESPSVGLKPIIDILLKQCNDELDKYSPAKWGGNINNKTYIMHGSFDNMVPYTESVKLASKVKNSLLHITDLYSHKDISFGKRITHSIKEIAKAIKFIRQYIRETQY